MRLLKSNLRKLSVLSCLGITAVLITACGDSGSGSGGSVFPVKPITPINPVNPVNPVNPIAPTACIDNPDPHTRLPDSPTNATADQVFHNYTSPDSTWQIYGYANPNPIHVKKINIFNNYSKVIFPVLFSPTVFTGSDGQQKTISRIFVGKPSCQDPTAFYAGIPPNGVASVYVPKQMWDAGHVKLFTEVPPLLQEDVGVPITLPIYTIDKTKASPNYGSLLYVSGTGNDFKQELPFQLTEYTIESNCFRDDPSCATVASDKLTVDFDISAVDQLFLPVSMQESTGSRGYVGTDMTVDAFQAQIKDFVLGQKAGFAYDTQVGWPFYYGSNGANGYLNNLIKIPMGNFTLTSLLFPSFSPFDPNPTAPTINNIWVYDKTVTPSVPVGDQATLAKIQNNLQTRWTNFWGGNPNICVGQDPIFCANFLKTMTFLLDNVVNACKFSLVSISQDPALCLTPRGSPLVPPVNPRSVLTDIDKIQKLLGYNFPGITFDNPGGTYPAVGTLDMCMEEFPSGKPRDGEFYSNCFRDAAKSVQRGVPYPFWLYADKFYPDLSSIYTLNPVVWFVHKQLNLSEYAFSVDDDIGNQELVGTGFNLTVGGLRGLVSHNAFEPRFKQILAFPGVGNPDRTTTFFWQGTITGTTAAGTFPFPACIPGQVGGCDINLQPGSGYSGIDVSLTGISAVTNPNYFLRFHISAGTPQLCSSANPQFNPNNPGATADYMFTPLVVSNCTTSIGLKNCIANEPAASFNEPTLSCAQTVSFAIPITG